QREPEHEATWRARQTGCERAQSADEAARADGDQRSGGACRPLRRDERRDQQEDGPEQNVKAAEQHRPCGQRCLPPRGRVRHNRAPRPRASDANAANAAAPTSGTATHAITRRGFAPTAAARTPPITQTIAASASSHATVPNTTFSVNALPGPIAYIP